MYHPLINIDDLKAIDKLVPDLTDPATATAVDKNLKIWQPDYFDYAGRDLEQQLLQAVDDNGGDLTGLIVKWQRLLDGETYYSDLLGDTVRYDGLRKILSYWFSFRYNQALQSVPRGTGVFASKPPEDGVVEDVGGWLTAVYNNVTDRHQQLLVYLYDYQDDYQHSVNGDQLANYLQGLPRRSPLNF